LSFKRRVPPAGKVATWEVVCCLGLAAVYLEMAISLGLVVEWADCVGLAASFESGSTEVV